MRRTLARCRGGAAKGLLALGMIAHGMWDKGAFLPAPSGTLTLWTLGWKTLAVLSAVIHDR